jgi:membrane associated rhomboid family serine protease
MAVYLMQIISGRLYPVANGLDPVTIWLGLNPFLIRKFALWQFFTYIFTHGSIWHLLLNMFVLWMFGSSMEQIWGSRRFLSYYFSTVFLPVSAHILSCRILRLVHREQYTHTFWLMFNLSQSPDLSLHGYPIKAKYFVMLIGGIELFSGIFSRSGGIAHTLRTLAGFWAVFYTFLFWHVYSESAKEEER